MRIGDRTHCLKEWQEFKENCSNTVQQKSLKHSTLLDNKLKNVSQSSSSSHSMNFYSELEKKYQDELMSSTRDEQILMLYHF